MTILPDGKVGIGTTSPGALLDVSGGAMRAGYDADTTSYFGRAAIGYPGFSDWASFAHIDNNTQTNYSIMQAASGTTFINAPTNEKAEPLL